MTSASNPPTAVPRLEGFALDEPQADGDALFDHTIADIESAQAHGYVDPAWRPIDLLTVLFGIGLAWAHAPDPHATSEDDPSEIDRRRAAAVEAARRIVTPPKLARRGPPTR